MGQLRLGHRAVRLPLRHRHRYRRHVYVADTVNDRVQKFASNGTFLGAWGSAGRRPGQFHTPLAIATDTGGYVYVADEGAPYPFGDGSARIQKFTSLGGFVTQWRSPPLPQRPARPRISTALAGETTKRTATFRFGLPQRGLASSAG